MSTYGTINWGEAYGNYNSLNDVASNALPTPAIARAVHVGEFEGWGRHAAMPSADKEHHGN